MDVTTRSRLENFRKWWAPGLILPAAFFAVALSLLWTPMDSLADQLGSLAFEPSGLLGESADSFDRVIGQALVYGIDSNSRVSNMTFWGFAYLPLLFVLCWGALGLLFRGHVIDPEGRSFLDRLTAAAFPALGLTVLARLDTSFFAVFDLVSIVAVLAVVVYLRFGAEKLPLKAFKWAFFTAFVAEIFLARALFALDVGLLGADMQFEMATAGAYLAALLILCLAVGVVKEPRRDGLCAASTAFYAAPVLVSLFLELANVLNQHEIYLGHKTLLSMVIGLGTLLAGAAWYFARGAHGGPAKRDYTRWQYPLLILGLTMLVLQPARQIMAGTELFETSNAGSDVYAFLTAGEIPLVENLNVHMVLEEIGAVLYGSLNRDPLGAIWFFYPVVDLLGYLAFYWLFTTLTDRETGLLITLFFPVWGMMWLLSSFSNELLYGMLLMVVCVAAARRKDRRTIVFFVVCCALLCLFRADVGVSTGFAAVLVLTVWFLAKKEKKPLCVLWVSGVCVVALLGVLFVLACLLRGISPLARLLEAVSLLWAFALWTYRQVVSEFSYPFFLCYLLVPIGTVVGVVLVFIRWRKKQVPDGLFLLDVLLACAYLFNFSRGIVRHSLLEGFYMYAIGQGVLCIVLSLWIYGGRRAVRLPLYLCGILVLQALLTGTLSESSTLLGSSIDRQRQTEPYETVREKIDRVVIPEELKAVYEPLKTVFDATLTPEQTYLDYSYQTLLYALTDRNKPVYTNQSPSELNAEFDHLLFLREIQEMDCPYALSRVSGTGFDGIDLDMNHYLVAEYLYQNYRPLCQIGEFCLWARSGDYERLRGQVRELISSGAVDGALLQGDEPFLTRTYEMGRVPWMWGAYDRAEPQEVLRILDETAEAVGESVDLYSGQKPGQFRYEARSEWLAENGENVRVAVWCSSEGDQDDLIWYPLEREGDVFTVTVDTDDHMQQTGDYQLHLYYDDEAGEAQFYDALTEVITEQNTLAEPGEREVSFALRPDELDRSDGNYLELEALTEQEGKAVAELLSETGDVLCTMRFDLLPGQNRYMIRVSMNYMWNTDQAAFLRVRTDEELTDLTVRVLRGDVNYGNMNFLQRMVLDSDVRLNAAAAREVN